MQFPFSDMAEEKINALVIIEMLGRPAEYTKKVMEILYATGIRHKEIIELKTEDINFKEKIGFLK